MSSYPAVAYQIKLVKLKSVVDLMALTTERPMSLKDQIIFRSEISRISNQLISTNTTSPHRLPRKPLLGNCTSPALDIMNQIRVLAQHHRRQIRPLSVHQTSRERLMKWVG